MGTRIAWINGRLVALFAANHPPAIMPMSTPMMLAVLSTPMLMSRTGASIEIPIMMSIPITMGLHCSDWSWLCMTFLLN